MADSQVLHVLSYVIPTLLEVDLVPFLKKSMKDKFVFALYQVETDRNTDSWPDDPIGPIFGYNEQHLLPYISDPLRGFSGSFIIHNGKLIYQSKTPILEEMRDSYLWAYSVDKYYAKIGAMDLVRKFLEAGYQLFQYVHEDRFAATFVYAPNGVANLKKQNLSKRSLDNLFF
jgi:hypothetical protein